MNINLPTQTKGTATQDTTGENEVKYQHYQSSRQSTKLLTPTGKKIAFINFQFITADEECIAYLNDEIAKGLPGITKGKLMTRTEADPMEALKEQLRKELIEQEAEKIKQAALGKLPNMGNTKPEHEQPKNVVGSDKVTNSGATSVGKSK